MATQTVAATEEKTPEQRSFWRRTRLYLLEYSLYHVFLVVLLTYIAYTFYALFWGLAGKPLNLALVQANVWFMAGGFVFAPAAYILHTRTRWEEVANPARHKQGLRQAIMYIQLIVAIIAVVVFLLIGVINVLRVVIGLTDMSTLLTIAVPSLINAAIMMVAVLDIFTKQSRRSLSLFRPVFFGVCILVNVVLLVISVVYGQSVRYDLQTMRDLKVISEQVDEKYDQNRSIVRDIDSLDLDEDIVQRASERNYTIESGSQNENREDYPYSTYRYSSGRYSLCADFKHKVGGAQHYSYRFNIDAAHDAGYQCFSLTTY